MKTKEIRMPSRVVARGVVRSGEGCDTGSRAARLAGRLGAGVRKGEGLRTATPRVLVCRVGKQKLPITEMRGAAKEADLGGTIRSSI